MTFEGLSGTVSFDSNGDRTNYTIDIYMGKGETVYVHNSVEVGSVQIHVSELFFCKHILFNVNISMNSISSWASIELLINQ